MAAAESKDKKAGSESGATKKVTRYFHLEMSGILFTMETILGLILLEIDLDYV